MTQVVCHEHLLVTQVESCQPPQAVHLSQTAGWMMQSGSQQPLQHAVADQPPQNCCCCEGQQQWQICHRLQLQLLTQLQVQLADAAARAHAHCLLPDVQPDWQQLLLADLMASEVRSIHSVQLSAVALAAAQAELTCAIYVGMHAMALGMLMTEHLLQGHGQQQWQQQQKLVAFLMQQLGKKAS